MSVTLQNDSGAAGSGIHRLADAYVQPPPQDPAPSGDQRRPGGEEGGASKTLESELHGVAVRVVNGLFGLPPQISGTSEGGGFTSGTTTDGARIDRAVLAKSTTDEVVISREVTAGGHDQVVVTTGDADDHVHVSQREDGSLDVTVNGQSTNIVLGSRQELVIRTQGGDDFVVVDASVSVNVVAELGDGDDTIHASGSGSDRIHGGDGEDTIIVDGGAERRNADGDLIYTEGNYVDAGRGDDTVIATGGNNVVYGGYGDDAIRVEGDFNYVDGGRGDDGISVQGDTNVIIGGRGDDDITSSGDNVIYSGRGRDSIEVLAGDSTVYGQFGMFDAWNRDTLTVADGASVDRQQVDLPLFARQAPVEVEGSQAFQDRVESDLDFLEASPGGQQMFDEFRAAAAEGNTVSIRELQNQNNGFAAPLGDRGFIGQASEGEGVDVRISYNPEFFRAGPDGFPNPAVILYHEMSHAYNGVTGTYQPGTYRAPDGEPSIDNGVNNRERQAVGVETSNTPYDYDGDPDTPPTTHNPYHLTENGIREEMGLPLRESYRR